MPLAESRAGMEKHRDDGESFFALGIDHPYRVVSKETPSLLPEGSIAVRLHSIGGWGMITTGKNLSEIISEIGDVVSKKKGSTNEHGLPEETIHISANPKYGSEKKGAPTEFFLVASPDRARVNCDLRHVNVVLCCDPKAFTHIDPLEGMVEGGIFVWESDEDPATAWERIPPRARQAIIEKKIRVFILPASILPNELHPGRNCSSACRAIPSSEPSLNFPLCWPILTLRKNITAK